MALTEQEMLAELRQFDTPLNHECGCHLSDKPTLPWTLQPMDRKLVHGYYPPVYVP